MKKKYLSFFVTGLLLVITSCGNKGEKQIGEDSHEDGIESMTGDSISEVSEPEQTNYEPPFTLNGVLEEIRKDGNKIEYGARTWYTIEVNKNGLYKATVKNELNSWRSNGEWVDDGINEYSGRWTVTYRTVGETSQKVYDLRHKDGDTFVYIPDDLEYFWSTHITYGVEGAPWRADWEDCANFNLNKAIKVTEFTTPKGKTILVPEDERVEKEPELPKGPDVVGKTYVYENVTQDTRFANSPVYKSVIKWKISKDSIDVDFLEYENEEETSHSSGTMAYTYKGNTLYFKREYRATPFDAVVTSAEVIDDGRCIQCYGRNYNLLVK